MKNRIPDKILKGIFPKKFSRFQSLNKVYGQLKKMILAGKLKKGQKLTQGEIVQRFNLSWVAVGVAFSRLKKEKLLITKRGIGSFVT